MVVSAAFGHCGVRSAALGFLLHVEVGYVSLKAAKSGGGPGARPVRRNTVGLGPELGKVSKLTINPSLWQNSSCGTSFS